MARRTHHLKRADIRQETDRPTNSVVLRYVGSTLEFDSRLYGYPEDTFFAVQLGELPWPEHLEDLSHELGIAIDPLPDAPRLKHAVAEALAAGAMVDAPELMDELDVDREVEWPEWELSTLERRHRIAESRVADISRLIENDMKLRASGIAKPSFEVPPLPRAAPEPAPEPEPVREPERPPEAPETPAEARGEAEEEVEVVEPGSKTVKRARAAVVAARETELPQRLPGGARRRLRKMPPGAYVAYSEVLDARLDLCAAMTDARSMGRADRETVVIDYDGEWPVVVRRYGKAGRTIYKVEDALRRHGIEVPDRD